MGTSAFPTPPVRAGSILVVDDEPDIRLAVRSAIAGIAERVLEGSTGAQAIDLAAAEHPDVVVLDLGLPDMPGIDVCRSVRRWTTLPILILSVHNSEQEKVTLLDAGADDYVTKPFGARELAARVQAQIRRAR
ncbi:MAG: DNA-binding response regulator, partial [Meiothermus sp.]